MEPIRSLLSPQLRPSPDYSWVGSCIISFEACSAFTHVTTCRLTESPFATLYTGGSGGFVASTAAPIVTGWSDPVPGRVFLPAVDQRLFTAHCHGLITPVAKRPSPGERTLLCLQPLNLSTPELTGTIADPLPSSPVDECP